MTATIFLVRHATHGLLGRVLAGRLPGVPLDEDGRLQAERLAERLSRETISLLQTSPLERARETAAAIGTRLGLVPESVEAISEIDYGAWTGRSFDELGDDLEWTAWTRSKATLRPPGGEALLDVQHRVVSHLQTLMQQLRNAAAVLVSHGDVIKVALAYYLGLSVEAIARFEVSPASVSTLAIGDWGAKVLAINEVPSSISPQRLRAGS
jgi:broad specificity phosphatase PhoE